MPLFTSLVKKLIKRQPQQKALPGVGVSQKIPAKGWSASGGEKEKKSKKNGRLATIGLFFLTALACLAFYLKTEIPLIWQKFSSPVVISSLPPEVIFDPSPVLTAIENLTKDLRGEYGVYVYRLDSKESYGIKKNQVFTAASLIKLPVILATYQEAEAGRLKSADYRELLEAMGKRSDNAAFNQMVKALGQAKIQATIDNLGMKATSFVKNETAPVDIGLFFQKLYQGKLITDQHRDEFMGFLTDTIYEDRIPAGVPTGTRVSHKIGTELGAYADAGIVFSPPAGGPAGGFILVIMSDGAREAEAKEVIPRISQAVWEFENPIDD